MFFLALNGFIFFDISFTLQDTFIIAFVRYSVLSSLNVHSIYGSFFGILMFEKLDFSVVLLAKDYFLGCC